MNRIISENYVGLFSDLSIISSFLSLLISIFLLWQATKIYKSFLQKARFPPIIKNLTAIYKEIDSYLEDFDGNREKIYTKLLETKSIVENLEEKLTVGLGKRKCKYFIKKYYFRHRFSKHSKTEFSLDECTVLLRLLSELTVTLSEHQKDLKWRN